jgi:hypothetical protein
MKMKRRYALNIFMGMAIGAVFIGTAFSPTIRNAYLGPALGVVGGMFISWLIVSAVRENESLNKSDVTPSDIEINPNQNQLNARYTHGNPILNPR